jgi:hypothetical protein
MTDANITEFISEIHDTHGLVIDRCEASFVLGARDLLAVEPNNLHARNTMKSFAALLATGDEAQLGLDCFLIPEEYLDTVEQKEMSAKIRREYLEVVARTSNTGEQS